MSSPSVDMVSFTGSTGWASASGRCAGRSMKRQLMELGGKGAALVFDDADLKHRDRQHLVGVGVPLRPDLHRADPCHRAARRLRPAGRGAREGRRPHEGRRSARPPSTVVGPVISAVQRGRIEGLVEPGIAEGADDRWPAASDPTSTAASTSARRCSPSANPTTDAVLEEFFGPGGRGDPLRRRRRGHRHRQRHRVRPLRLRLHQGHRPGLRRGPPAAHRQRRASTRPAQPRGTLRWLQEVRRRSRRRRATASTPTASSSPSSGPGQSRPGGSVDLEPRHELGPALLEGVEVDLLGVVPASCSLARLANTSPSSWAGVSSTTSSSPSPSAARSARFSAFAWARCCFSRFAPDLAEGGALSGHRALLQVLGWEQERLPTTARLP